MKESEGQITKMTTRIEELEAELAGKARLLHERAEEIASLKVSLEGQN